MASPNTSVPTAKTEHAGGDIGPGTVLIERFLVEEALEESDSARVYAAEHLFLRKKLVVKVVPRERADVEELRTRFEREAMLAARLDHAHLASAVDFGALSDGTPFFVMEFAQGKSLRAALEQGPLPLARSLRIARHIAAALSGLRELDLVHGDLRPENVMLTEHGDDSDFAKVLNLGLATLRCGADGPAKRLPYLAPEQVLEQAIDARTDLYALGVILYEMLTGKHPYAAPPSAEQKDETVAPLASLLPNVAIPEELEQLAQRLVTRNSGERLSSAQSVLQSLERLSGAISGAGTKLAAAPATPVLAKQITPPQVSTSKAVPPPPPVRHPRPKEASVSAPPPAPGATESGPAPVVTAAAPVAPAVAPAAAPAATAAAVAAPAATAAPATAAPAAVPAATAAPATAEPVAPVAAPPVAAAPVAAAPAAAALTAAAPTATAPTAASAEEENPGASLVDEDDDAPTRLALPKIHLPPRAGAEAASPAPSPSVPPASAAASLSAAAAQSITPPMGQSTPPASLGSRKSFWDAQKTQEWGKRVKDRAEMAYLDASITLGQWRDKARERLRGRKERIVVSTAAGAGLGLLVIGLFALRSPSNEQPEPSNVHAAVGAESEAKVGARADGETSREEAPKTLSAPAGAAQDETSVFLNLASNYANEHRDAEAVALVSRELLRHPELKNDVRVAAVLSRTIRSDSRHAADESFAQLSGAMGAAGAEILYAVANDPDVRDSVRKRSEDWLNSKDFDRNSSGALYSAVKLRHAKNCEQKRALLPLAADVGGKQTLEYLRELDARVICRPNDLSNCYPCMAGDSRLKDTIQRIEKRLASRG